MYLELTAKYRDRYPVRSMYEYDRDLDGPMLHRPQPIRPKKISFSNKSQQFDIFILHKN